MSLQTLAQQHQNAILAREAAAGIQITDQWKTAKHRILARLHWFFAQVASAAHTGQPVNMAWLYQEQRLTLALAQIEAEMSSFSSSAKATVASQIAQAHQIGRQDAQALVQHALVGVSVQLRQPQPQAVSALSQRLETGPVAKRFAQMPADAVKRAKGTLLAGVANGWGAQQIARQLQYDLHVQLSDALRISRTESMQSYRDSALDNYRANSDVVIGWQWLAEFDACPICLDLNGSQYDLSEDFDGAHVNCRCSSIPLVKSYDEILQGEAA